MVTSAPICPIPDEPILSVFMSRDTIMHYLWYGLPPHLQHLRADVLGQLYVSAGCTHGIGGIRWHDWCNSSTLAAITRHQNASEGLGGPVICRVVCETHELFLSDAPCSVVWTFMDHDAPNNWYWWHNYGSGWPLYK